MKYAVFLVLNSALCLLLAIITLKVLHEYLLLLAAVFLKPGAVAASADTRQRFLVLVPAHNEREVIEYLVESVQRSNYPPELLTLVVIADNCSDDTAEIVRSKGALALERHDLERRGKPFAISWALQQPELAGSPYHAVVILDADNLVHPDFFQQASQALNRGARAFQGVVETKNRLDSWVCAGNYVLFAVLNRITQAGRSRLGLGVHLFGTGMGFTRELLEIVPWNAESLTEDKEFTYKLLLKGVKVAWLEHAVVYDEKTVSAKESFNQQSRWRSGYYADFRKFAPLMLRALKNRFDWSLLDCLYHMMQPLMPAKNVISLILLLILNKSSLWLWWGCLILASFGIQCAGLALNKTRILEYRFLLFSFPYKVLTLVVSLMTLVSGPDRSWRHTKHTKGVGIDKIT